MAKKIKNKTLPLPTTPTSSLKLDFGCGKNPQPGFDGVDQIDFGQKYVMDLRRPWTQWKNESVNEAYSSHFIEHLDGTERVHFFNELYRVMEFGAKAIIICPVWNNSCAYGDPTHKFPPISEWMVYYLNKGWRDVNGPHTGYTCDFDYSCGYPMDPNDPEVSSRNQTQQLFASRMYVNYLRDIHITLFKTKR